MNDYNSSSPAALRFEREDWTSFLTIEGLQQKAGVSKDKLTRLVLKELADNGLDTNAYVRIGELPNGGYLALASTARPRISPTCSRSRVRCIPPSCCGCRSVAL
jgi:hypothetical protein